MLSTNVPEKYSQDLLPPFLPLKAEQWWDTPLKTEKASGSVRVSSAIQSRWRESQSGPALTVCLIARCLGQRFRQKDKNKTKEWAEVNTKLTPGIGPVHLGHEESPQPLPGPSPLWLLLLLALSCYQGKIRKPAWDQPWEISSRRWRGLYKTPRFEVKLMISCQNTKRWSMGGASRREKE